MQYVNAMIRESMEIPSPGRNAGWTENGGENKVIVELPIYVGKTYSKTEIVEIAMNGIAAIIWKVICKRSEFKWHIVLNLTRKLLIFIISVEARPNIPGEEEGNIYGSRRKG